MNSNAALERSSLRTVIIAVVVFIFTGGEQMGELKKMMFEPKRIINGQPRGIYRCPWCKTAYVDSFFDDIDGEIFDCIDCDLQLKNPRYLEFNLDFSL